MMLFISPFIIKYCWWKQRMV